MSSSHSRRDYYEALGVEPSATIEEIEKAYRDLLWIYHPDRLSASEQHKGAKERAQEKLKFINEAKAVLTDPVQRRAYDYERLAQEQVSRAGAQHAEPSSHKRRPSKRPPQGSASKRPAENVRVKYDDDEEPLGATAEAGNSESVPVDSSADSGAYIWHTVLYPYRRDRPSEPGLPSWLAVLLTLIFLFLISGFQVVPRIEVFLPLRP